MVSSTRSSTKRKTVSNEKEELLSPKKQKHRSNAKPKSEKAPVQPEKKEGASKDWKIHTVIGDPPRCWWSGNTEIYQAYHDDEWGIPCYEDEKLFEMINLEGAQAGLSWLTILKKRESYRAAFADWDARKIAKFTNKDVERLMQDEGIVRNRLKILATIDNAKGYLDIQNEFGSFSNFVWEFAKKDALQPNSKILKMGDIPAKTPQSELMSKALKGRGFRFVGPTICYAFMQACGIVNDHIKGCHKYGPQS